MRVEQRLGQLPFVRPARGYVGLHDEQRAGRPVLLRHRVDDHEHVVPVHELVDQVHRADAEVDELGLGRERVALEGGRDLHAEPVVGQEDVAHAGHEHPGHHAPSSRSGSTSSGEK